MVTRRMLLKAGGALFLSTLLGGRSAFARIFSGAERAGEPRLRENVFKKDGLALAGISGADNVMEAVSEAVSLIGGLERLSLKGKTVLVKPNVLSGRPSPTTTNPEVVATVVKLLYEQGAKKVYCGDMSALATLSTIRNMKKSGIYRAAKDAGAEVIAFEDYEWVDVRLEGTDYVKNAYVTEWIYNVDAVINLPVVKTHGSATYTISLKNFIGCTHLRQRPYLIDSSHWEEIIAEFNLAYAPELNIVDATASMVDGGPWKGAVKKTGLIIATGDRIAADITGLGIIKSFGSCAPVASRDVWEQRQIKTALKFGLGASRENMRLVPGKGIDKDGIKNALVRDIIRLTGIKVV